MGEGFSIFGKLRQNQRTRDVPLILMAPANEEDQAEVAHALSADDCLKKPLFASDVVSLGRLQRLSIATTARFTISC